MSNVEKIQNKKIPDGFIQCNVCREYKGKTKAKNLNWEGTSHADRNMEEDIGVSCLCDGIPCPKCKKNKIHQPITNSYEEEENRIGHWPWFSGMKSCRECRTKASPESK